MDKRAIQVIGKPNLPKDLNFELAVILMYEPMKESKYKIYEKLSPKAQAGMLIRHMMGVGKRCGISDDFLKELVLKREDFNYWGKEHADASELARDEKYKNDIKVLLRAVQVEAKYLYIKILLVKHTYSLLRKITKTDKFNKKVDDTNVLYEEKAAK